MKQVKNSSYISDTPDGYSILSGIDHPRLLGELGSRFQSGGKTPVIIGQMLLTGKYSINKITKALNVSWRRVIKVKEFIEKNKNIKLNCSCGRPIGHTGVCKTHADGRTKVETKCVICFKKFMTLKNNPIKATCSHKCYKQFKRDYVRTKVNKLTVLIKENNSLKLQIKQLKKRIKELT